VLAEIDAADIPQIIVMNKIDAAEELKAQGPLVERNEDRVPARVFISARDGIGLDRLREAIVDVAQWLADRPVEFDASDPRRLDLAPPHARVDSEEPGID
jgi:GTP-binding protein HflX